MAQNTITAFNQLASLINWSEDARKQRAQALDSLALPYDCGYVRGIVPREYLRIMAEEDAAPEGAAQMALHLHDLARAAGLEAEIEVDEYQSPSDVDVRLWKADSYMGCLMVQSCGYGRSYILDGTYGYPMEGNFAQWANYFRQRAAGLVD